MKFIYLTVKYFIINLTFTQFFFQTIFFTKQKKVASNI